MLLLPSLKLGGAWTPCLALGLQASTSAFVVSDMSPQLHFCCIYMGSCQLRTKRPIVHSTTPHVESIFSCSRNGLAISHLWPDSKYQFAVLSQFMRPIGFFYSIFVLQALAIEVSVTQRHLKETKTILE